MQRLRKRLATVRPSTLFAACLTALWLGGCAAAGSVAEDAGSHDTASHDAGCTIWDAVGQPGHLDAKKPSAWLGGSDKDAMTFVDWNGGQFQPAIISGPQGGQHIWVSVRARNVSPSKLRMGVQMIDLETCEVVKPGRVEITHTMNVKPDGMLEYTGIPAFVKEPCKIRGRKLKVHLDISDLYGVTAEDEQVITPTWDGWCPPEPDAIGSPNDATTGSD